MTRALVAGWFSLERCGATAGDLLAKDVACDWLDRAGVAWDVALAAPFTGGVDWDDADPDDYTHVVFVGGPLVRSNLLKRFEQCKLVGVNVSMMEAIDCWNPFDLLIERDSSAASHPDLTFLAEAPTCPVVGIALLEDPIWEELRPAYDAANRAVERLIDATPMSVVRIDTNLDGPNRSGLRTPAEIVALISRMDVVITTRLHGMVLALKNGVPAVAVDPIADGGKISRQAEAIGWPIVYRADRVSDSDLLEGLSCSLDESMQQAARDCSRRAADKLTELRDQFIATMREPTSSSTGWGDGRGHRIWDTAAPGTGRRYGTVLRRLMSATRRR
jgi:hypothetical protein